MEEYNTSFLGIKDIFVENLEEDDDTIVIHATTPPKPNKCPCCGKPTSHIHDYRYQNIKDLPYRNKSVYIRLKKRRYRCKSCNKRFLERYWFLPRYHHMTRRVYESVMKELRDTSVTMKSTAKRFNISSNTVSRVFDIVSYSLNKLPAVLSIDEFKGNAGNERFQAILTNPDKRKVLDILPNREMADVFRYFEGFKNKDKVKYFVMDMWEPYKNVAKLLFPNATIVIDKYHYVRQVYWALDKVRKRAQKKFYEEKRKYFKRSKKLLFAEYDKLNDENKQAVQVMLAQSSDLHTAWTLKELFISVRQCKDSKEGGKQLHAWIETAEGERLPEFKDCCTAFKNWSPYILNSLDCPYTNGYTEGINNRIKVLKRCAYGYRNFPRFRNRILHTSA